jgi:hypothetical protein
MKRYFFEIFEDLEKCSNISERISYIQNEVKADPKFEMFLNYVYNVEKYQFRDDLVIPTYKINYKTHFTLFQSNLRRETKLFYILLKDRQTTIAYRKIKQLLERIVNEIPPQEVEVFEFCLKNRRLPYSGLTKNVIVSALPHLFSDEEVAEAESRRVGRKPKSIGV